MMAARQARRPPWHDGAAETDGPRIRRAVPADLPRIAEVEQASFSTPWSRAAFLSVMERGEAVVLVAERGDRVVGHGVMWQVADEAEVANLAVAPEARRQGIARAILERMIADAEASGAKAVFLEVRFSNRPAASLYESRGFRPVGVRRHYYERPREDARVLRLDLAG